MATIAQIHKDVILTAEWQEERRVPQDEGPDVIEIDPFSETITDGFELLAARNNQTVVDGKYTIHCESTDPLYNSGAYLVDTQGVFLDVPGGYGSRRSDVWTLDPDNDRFHNTATFDRGNYLDTQALFASQEQERRHGWTIIFGIEKFRGILVKEKAMAVNMQGGVDTQLNAALTCSRQQFNFGVAPFGFKDKIRVAGRTWSVEHITIRPGTITFDLAEFS